MAITRPVLKELAIWLLLLYPSVVLFSATTDYYQIEPSNKIVAAIFDPYLILTGWKGEGIPWAIATFVGVFVVLMTWNLLVRWFIGRPYKMIKSTLTVFVFILAWSLTGNFAVIKNSYEPIHLNPMRPIRTGYGCMSRKHVFWFIYEEYTWC